MSDFLGINTYRPQNAANYTDNNSSRQQSSNNTAVPTEAGGIPYEAVSKGVVNGVSGTEQEGVQKESSKSGRNRNKNFDSYECETCKNRKYQDGSDDPGVSFKTATKLSPEKAASAVRAHEQEHVTRERASAAREDRKVVSQSVTYHTAICPECGNSYVSGGTTRTVTKGQVDESYGLEKEEKGKYVDMAV